VIYMAFSLNSLPSLPFSHLPSSSAFHCHRKLALLFGNSN